VFYRDYITSILLLCHCLFILPFPLLGNNSGAFSDLASKRFLRELFIGIPVSILLCKDSISPASFLPVSSGNDLLSCIASKIIRLFPLNDIFKNYLLLSCPVFPFPGTIFYRFCRLSRPIPGTIFRERSSFPAS